MMHLNLKKITVTFYSYTHIDLPVVKLLVRPDRLPAPVLHSQSHLLQVPGVSVHKGRVHGFIFLRAGLRLRGSLTQTPSWNRQQDRGHKTKAADKDNTYAQLFVDYMTIYLLTCLVCSHSWTTALNLTQQQPHITTDSAQSHLLTHCVHFIKSG